jgi:hypothetical protein
LNCILDKPSQHSHFQLSSSQKDQAANLFGAETKFLSAGKKLIDKSHPVFKAVTNVRSQTIAYWKEVSLPFPEPGIRLIRLDAIEAFNQKNGRLLTPTGAIGPDA